MTALALDVRELDYDEIDLVGGAVTWKDFAVGVAAGVVATAIAPAVIAVAPIVAAAVVINLVVGVSPAH